MRFAVTAQAFNRNSGIQAGESRDEVIDTETNALFLGCSTILEMKAAYERFWNNLNPDSREIVFVQKVRIES
jgi:hypothetical protein